MRNMLRPRRLVVALLIAAFPLGTALAAGSWTGEPAESAQVELPPPKSGDRGAYVMERVRMGSDGAEALNAPLPYAVFAFDGPRPYVHADGRAGEALVFEAGFAGWRMNGTGADGEVFYEWADPRPLGILVDPETQAVRALRIDLIDWLDWQGRDEIEDLAGLGLVESRVRSDASLEWMFYATDEPLGIEALGQSPCGFLLDKPVLTVRVGEPLEHCRLMAPGPSPWNGGAPPEDHEGYQELHPQGPLMVERLAWQQGDGRLLAIEGDLEGRTVRMWYDERVPYPVQWAIQDEDMPDVWSVMRLDAFTRGTESWSGDGGLDGRPVTVGEAPIRPWGPDHTGMQHPFPPSEAWEWMTGQPNDGRAWLEAHPDAYLIGLSAQHSTWDQPGLSRYAWQFEYVAGARTAHITVEWDDEGPYNPPPEEAPGLPVPMAVFGNTPSVTMRESDVSSPVPGPEQVAAWGPSATALVEAFAKWSPETSADGWGFSVTCAKNCTQAETRYTVGTFRTAVEPGADEGGAYYDVARIESAIEWVDGRAVSFAAFDAQNRVGYGPAGDGPRGDGPAAAAFPAPGPMEPAAAAAIAALGLMAAIAYLLWPLLKGAPTALFSRIRHDKALDHPVRRQIMEAVETQPGIHLRETVRRTGLARGTVQHHLRKLHETGHVQVRQEAGYTCLFPRSIDRRMLDAAPALRSGSARRILEQVLREPGCSGAAIAETVGLNRSTVQHHLRRMARAGLVEFREAERGRSVYATPFASSVPASKAP